MNGKKLVNEMSKKSGLTKVDCEKALNSAIETIISTVSDGEAVKIIDFVTFEPITRNPRVGRNPKTGNLVDIPARKSVKFKIGKWFKDSVAE